MDPSYYASGIRSGLDADGVLMPKRRLKRTHKKLSDKRAVRRRMAKTSQILRGDTQPWSEGRRAMPVFHQNLKGNFWR